MDDQLKDQLIQKLSVALWPTAGKALGLGRNATYAAARRGDIQINRFGSKMTAPTAPLRRRLGLDDGKTAA